VISNGFLDFLGKLNFLLLLSPLDRDCRVSGRGQPNNHWVLLAVPRAVVDLIVLKCRRGRKVFFFKKCVFILLIFEGG
jgi:hypothetical protein